MSKSTRWLMVAVLFVALLLLASVGANTIRLPVLIGNRPYEATVSRYMYTVNPDALYAMGRHSGRTNEYGVVVLFFGAPFYKQDLRKYGTFLPDGDFFVTLDQVETAVKAWIEGYWQSTPTVLPQVTIVPSTSNYFINIASSHAVEWGEMIERLDTFVESQGWGQKIRVMSGINMELLWAGPQTTRSYVDAYDLAADVGFINIGACEGCPHDGDPSALPPGSWDLGDVWYISWGHQLAFPLPEIYAESGVNAAQWQYVAKWARQYENSNMEFQGVVTQFQACIDVNDPCPQEKNTLDQGWQQLFDALGSHSSTVQSTLKWGTDITWRRDF